MAQLVLFAFCIAITFHNRQVRAELRIRRGSTGRRDVSHPIILSQHVFGAAL
jgi:hypothetical protein